MSKGGRTGDRREPVGRRQGADINRVRKSWRASSASVFVFLFSYWCISCFLLQSFFFFFCFAPPSIPFSFPFLLLPLLSLILHIAFFSFFLFVYRWFANFPLLPTLYFPFSCPSLLSFLLLRPLFPLRECSMSMYHIINLSSNMSIDKKIISSRQKVRVENWCEINIIYFSR